MKKDIKPLLFSAISIMPLAGSAVSSYVLSEYLKDFFESLKYFPLILGLSLLSSLVTAYYFLRHWIIEVIAIVIIAPFLLTYLNTRKYESIRIDVNEYYIEIKFDVPMKKLSFDNPSDLFDYVFDKALKRMKPPYSFKLKSLNNCGNLKVIPKENSIILRKRCGDTVLEIVITNNEKANLKVTMTY